MTKTDHLPAHVRANIELAHELECEFLNRYRRANRGTSRTARYDFRGDPERRDAYFNELAAALAPHEAPAPVTPREETYETVIERFGGRFVGASLVTGRRNRGSHHPDDGIL